MKTSHLAAVAATVAGAVLSAGIASPAQAFTTEYPSEASWAKCDLTWTMPASDPMTQQTVNYAVGRLAQATGFTMTQTTTGPADISITYGTPPAGAWGFTTADVLASSFLPGIISSAQIVISNEIKPKAQYSRKDRERYIRRALRAVMIHELAHAAGLGHNDGDSSSAMHTNTNPRVKSYDADDLAGLDALSSNC